MVVGFCGWVVIRWWILISLDLLWINLSQNKKIRSPRHQADEKGGVKARKQARKRRLVSEQKVQTPYPRLNWTTRQNDERTSGLLDC